MVACSCFDFSNAENKAPAGVEEWMCVNVANFEDENGNVKTCAKMAVKAGWKWSEVMKPLMKTELCEKSHWGVVGKGSMKVYMKDEEPKVFSAGMAYYIPPQHDAEVLEDVEIFEFSAPHMQPPPAAK